MAMSREIIEIFNSIQYKAVAMVLRGRYKCLI